jgi:hypothetical protein
MYESTPGRKHLKAGDRVCFYAARVGVVAKAEIVGAADAVIPEEELPEPTEAGQPIYRVPLRSVEWLAAPVRVDEAVRGQLDAFQGRPPSAPWAWFIQSTSRLSERDFDVLTSQPVQAAG